VIQMAVAAVLGGISLWFYASLLVLCLTRRCQ